MSQDLFETRADKRAGGNKYQGVRLPVSYFAKHECSACPLKELHCELAHPDMPATGSPNPLVYVLGEAPGANEDIEGRQFVGKSGAYLRGFLRNLGKRVRYNNCVRTRPPNNRTPTSVEIECCRPSVVRDIEESKPSVIIGFGGVPLKWMTGEDGIHKWRGRRMPVVVGSHHCWFYPVYHPAYILRIRQQRSVEVRFGGNKKERLPGEEIERVFIDDLQRVVRDAVRGVPPAKPITVDSLLGGLVTVTPELGADAPKVLRKHLGRLARSKSVAFDIETNSTLRPFAPGARVTLIAFSNGREHVSVVLDHRLANWSPRVLRKLLDEIRRFQTSYNGRQIAHNLAFELEWLAQKRYYGRSALWAGEWHDTMLAAYVLDERPHSHSLHMCSIEMLGLQLKGAVGYTAGQGEYGADLRKQLQYVALDSAATWWVDRRQQQRIRRENLLGVYDSMRFITPALVDAQIQGLHIDQDRVTEFHAEFSRRAADLRSSMERLPDVVDWSRSHGAFNPDSPAVVSAVFRDQIKDNTGRVDGTDRYSVDESVLSKIKHPLASQMLEYRRVCKLLSTYVEPLRQQSPSSLVYPDGRVHTKYNQVFTRTIRLSSEDPNVQNFPKRKHKELRSMVAAPPGCIFLALDYGQIEARIIAAASKDEYFIDALWHRYDVHMFWAERLVQLVPEMYDRHERNMKAVRSVVKNLIVFPAFYGAGFKTISNYLQIELSVAEKIYRELWQKFKGVRRWQYRQKDFYTKHGYVESLFGVRRRAPISWNELINSPVQTDAGLLTAMAMGRVYRKGIELDRPWLTPPLEIHDDLTFCVPEKHLDAAIEIAVDCMLCVDFDWLSVPLSVEVSVGYNWADLEEVETFYSNEWSS